MTHYPYLIVGGGMTADSAVRGIREIDPNGAIAVVSAEPDPPYNRPPLSKALWKGAPIESIWRGTDGVELQLGRCITAIDPERRQAVDDRGTVSSFDSLLLATGGRPRRLPFGGDDIIYYRTLADYRRLRALADTAGRFVVIGGGFIGAEVAAALAMQGKRVTMLVPEEGLGFRVFPADLARFLVDYYREQGVEVLTGDTAIDVGRTGGDLFVRTKAGRALAADGVVAGIGIEPNTQLAEKAGLAVDRGIVVDPTLRTSHPAIFAAGDVAVFQNPALGRLRVEHEDNANTMGRLAGKSMAGAPATYDHLPFFYSDLFDLGYEAVGELDSRIQTVADWREFGREGVVYYLRDGRVRGALLWNVWGQVDAARALIAEPGPFQPSDLTGRIAGGSDGDR
jgi:NADPH-dependent 2,4-dienoyl-CoA reductase/sulfur reductase-like enzyme